MPIRKKVNIPREVCDKWIQSFQEITTACLEGIEHKFKNPEIFKEQTPLFYNTYSEMAPETLEIFNIMRLKCTWLLRHSINVAAISLLITHQLDYSPEEKRNVLCGALLHDVGKMIISGSILQKPSALTDEEMAVIMRHPLSGYHMIVDSAIPAVSKLIVLQHHERLDGCGYPDGICAESICEGAKIVMIADSLDAMTSFRPYKAAQNMAKALDCLQRDGIKYEQTMITGLKKLLRQ